MEGEASPMERVEDGAMLMEGVGEEGWRQGTMSSAEHPSPE